MCVRRHGFQSRTAQECYCFADGHQNRGCDLGSSEQAWLRPKQDDFYPGENAAGHRSPGKSSHLMLPASLLWRFRWTRFADVIGPGGKTIRKIIDQTGVSIDIEDDGRVYVASTNQEAGVKAQELIELLVKDVEVGETYLGTVKRIVDFGAFVEVLPGKEGLVHISKLAKGRVGKVEDVVQVGDTITVKVIEIDRMGRINLARPEALEGDDDKGSGRNGRGRRQRS